MEYRWDTGDVMNWPTGWLFRNSITASRSSGAVTNYQMRVRVGESSGSSSYDVHTGGMCLPSFNDLRFTAGDGLTALPYWVESVTGATPNQTAVVWVKFDSIITTDTTFYMYYGNTSASSESSGSSTFAVFDDAEHGSNGDTITSPWVLSTGAATVSTAQSHSGSRSYKLFGIGATASISRPFIPADNTSISIWLYSRSTYCGLLRCGNGSHSISLWTDSANNLSYNNSYNNGVTSGFVISPSTWTKIEVRNVNWTTATYDLYANDSLVLTSLVMLANTQFANVVEFVGDYGSGWDNWLDDFIVKSSVSPEPSISAYGAVEPFPDYVPSIILTPSLHAPTAMQQLAVPQLISTVWLPDPSCHLEVAVPLQLIEPQLLKPTGYRPLSVDAISDAGWVLTENNKRFIRGV